MSNIEIMGPSLRLIYRYLGQADLTDADKFAFAGELLGLVGDHQAETQEQVQAAMLASGIRLDAVTLLRQATTLLVREMMTLPADAADADNHGWHCVGVADGVERIFERLGYWSIAASQARMDVKSARLRTVRSAVDPAAKAAAANLPDVDAETDIEIMVAATRITAGDWTPEDDRLVLIGRIADVIETMPIEKLQRVLLAAKGIRDE